MSLFSNNTLPSFLYLLLFFSLVVSNRISDKRKCADADCKQPVSMATTLLRYNADDDRLVSFPRNAKVKVFSKEAGDNPNFWEIQEEGTNKCMNYHGSLKQFLKLCHDVVNGKRGYVYKDLVREDKVLISSKKLTHIVPTGRTDNLKKNATDKNMDKSEFDSTNPFTATPELPVANSKGLFSTIGGVSADSVPMNSPDIKPQSTRKFRVLEGTTIYDDVVTEKPESPPTVIHDTGNENQMNSENPQRSIDEPSISDVPSTNTRPVTEKVNENEQADGDDKAIDIETDKLTKGENDHLINEEESSKKKIEDEENQPKESDPSFLENFVDTVANFMSSGAGEGVVEEETEEKDEVEEDDGSAEEDEGSAEEEEYEDEEGEIAIEGRGEETKIKELDPLLQQSPKTTSEAPSVINVADNSSINLKLVEMQTLKSEISNDEQGLDKTTTLEEDINTTKELVKNSIDIRSNLDMGMKNVEENDEAEHPSRIPENKENNLSEPSEGDLGFESVLGVNESSLVGMNKQPEIEITGENISSEPSPHLSKKENEDRLTVEVKTDDNKSYSKDSFLEETNDQLNEAIDSRIDTAIDSNAESNTEEPQSGGAQVRQQVGPDDKVLAQTQNGETIDQGQPSKLESSPTKINEVLLQKQVKTIDAQVQEQVDSDEIQVQEQPKTNEELAEIDVDQFSGQPQTDDSHIQDQNQNDQNDDSKSDESQTEKQPLTDDQKIEEKLDNATELPVANPTASQFLFGSNQLKDSSETPSPSKSRELEAEDYNDTAQASPSPQYPEYPSIPPVSNIESPKYASVINRRIQSSESYSVNQVQLSSEEEKDDSDDTINHEETLSPHLLLHSQSPKYSSVIKNRIGSLIPPENLQSESTPDAAPEPRAESNDTVETDDKIDGPLTVEFVSQPEVIPAEVVESITEQAIETNKFPIEDSPLLTPSDEVSSANVIDEISDNVLDETSASIVSDSVGEMTSEEEGMFSWVISYFDVFGRKDDSIEELPASENLNPSKITYIQEETCSADGVEGSCPTFEDSTHKEVTWQEASYTSDMWELMDRIPLEATVWLIITAVVVLIFSLGHYYIEAHRRDGPLVAIINKLEREVLILKKETCIMEDRLQIAQQELEAWNTSSTENDALLVELKQELEETKAVKAELEEQAAQLKEELETVTESGLEMHRLLEESLSSQDGSQVLLSTVETLREKLQRQEEEISELSDTLSSKNAEVEELEGKLAHSAEVAQGLEDKVISVMREKDEELLQLRDKHRELISQMEEVMETKALEETRLSTEMSKLHLIIKELQKTLSEKDSELDTLKEVVKQLRATDSNEKIEALFDVVAVQAKLRTAVAERDDFREKFLEEEGARKLLEGHMKRITQEVAELKNSFETAEKEKIEALTKLQVLSNYFKEKESQLQKELGMQESMWLQKQSDDHSIYEQMRSLREENEKYKITKGEPQTNSGPAKPMPNLAEVKTKKKSNPKLGSVRQTSGLQNESLKKEIVEQEASFKIQLANTEQKAHENWVTSRQAERKLKEAQQEAAQLRNRLTTVEKNTANYSLDEKQNISESNGDPSSPPPSLMFPPTTSPPFMMYGPPMPPHGDFVPPPPLMGSPYPSDSRPPPLGRISSPPLDHRFSPPPPLPYPPYDYSPYGHHSPSPPPPMPPHRNVHKPKPREMTREQKEHVPTYSPEAEKTSRRNKR